MPLYYQGWLPQVCFSLYACILEIGREVFWVSPRVGFVPLMFLLLCIQCPLFIWCIICDGVFWYGIRVNFNAFWFCDFLCETLVQIHINGDCSYWNWWHLRSKEVYEEEVMLFMHETWVLMVWCDQCQCIKVSKHRHIVAFFICSCSMNFWNIVLFAPFSPIECNNQKTFDTIVSLVSCSSKIPFQVVCCLIMMKVLHDCRHQRYWNGWVQLVWRQNGCLKLLVGKWIVISHM